MPKPVSNPPNPWESAHRVWLGEPPPVELRVFEERAKSIVTENRSPDVPFRFGVNPYRGCFHGCAYCYARPTHQYLGFGAGTDFDRILVAKTNAPELLDRELSKRKKLHGETLHFSGNTDCYQPLEASYELTARCLQVCLSHQVPISVITKGSLVRRDAELLSRIEETAGARVTISIPFAEDSIGRKIEPFAASVSERFETIRILSEQGIPTQIAIAPVIPGLNDDQIPALLERAWNAGARGAGMILLRLTDEVAPIFEERVREVFPQRIDKILSSLRNARQGGLSDAGFGARMTGRGPRWAIVQRLFETTCQKLGFERGENLEVTRVPRRHPPTRHDPQGTLFDLGSSEEEGLESKES